MYGSVSDMVDRFGEEEMIDLTTPKNEERTTVRPARIIQALTDASGLVDSYLRRRYATPVASPPPEIVRVAAHLARYDLAMRCDMTPTEQMQNSRKEQIKWLGDLAAGSVTLDGVLPIGQASFARTRDRSREGCTRGSMVDPTSDNFWL